MSGPIAGRSISRSIRAASSALTSTIGNRSSALSISPVRHSQCLIGAGIGSEKNRPYHALDRPPARQRGLRSPAATA